MVGKTFGRYVVRQWLGRGGMGEVYLADDTALGRRVALKLLAADLRERPEARRHFLREARAAAALDHPFICKVYETGEAEQIPFIALEYVEGSVLRSRIAGGPMPLGEALQIAAEIAEALDVAHRRGIIHRDLKPGNIALTEQGHVKVLDFGLAEWLPEFRGAVRGSATDSSSTLSDGKAAVGTPGYISPEQLRGKPATAQSDIFALGIVLYQMLTGNHPFLRASPVETADALFREPEAPLARYRADAPVLLQHVVRKMLAKDPALRYQSAHEVHTDLLQMIHPSDPHPPTRPPGAPGRRWRQAILAVVGLVVVGLVLRAAIRRPPSGGPRPQSPPRPIGASLAVLPFVDLSQNHDFDYFCDGITDQIISVLGGVEGLRVTARTSVFAFKGRSEDVREIGRKLQVARLLEGSVLRAAGRIRVTVKLINADDGFETWSKTYDRALTDVFEIQDAISSEVARELRLELRSHEETRSAGHPTEDSEAYLLYLKGRFYWNQRTPASLETALRYFNEALERDPRFALAHVGIADAYYVLEANQRIAPAEALDRVRKAVTRALEIDDTLAEAHASRAVLMEREWNWDEAEREFRRALKLKPGEVRILCWHAQFLAELGRHDEALARIHRALDLDPLSSYVKVVHGLVLYLARRYDEAQRQLAFTMDLDPDDEAVHDQLAYVYAQKGMHEEALAAASRASTLRGDATTSVVLGYTSAVAGRRDSALAIVRRLIEQWERRQGSPAGIGVIYAALGDRDAALRWLETAYSEHDSWVTFLKVDAVFDTLRADARFTALLEKTALAEGAAPSGRRPL